MSDDETNVLSDILTVLENMQTTLDSINNNIVDMIREIGNISSDTQKIMMHVTGEEESDAE